MWDLAAPALLMPAFSLLMPHPCLSAAAKGVSGTSLDVTPGGEVVRSLGRQADGWMMSQGRLGYGAIGLEQRRL